MSCNATQRSAQTQSRSQTRCRGDTESPGNVRELIPNLNKEEAPPPRKKSSTDERMAPMHMSADAMEEFEYMAVIEGLASVAQDIGEALEQKHAKLGY